MRSPNIDLTQRLNSLKKFFYKFKRIPTYEEMLDLFGVSSKNAVFGIINKLIEVGVVVKDDDGKVSPTNLFFSLPLLGSIKAGFPTLEDYPENLSEREYLSLDEYVIGKADRCYALKVSGDSMIDEGIRPADTVLIDSKRPPKRGDIVAAYVDNEWTLKYYEPEKNNNIRLMPANRKYSPIIPKNTLEIGGVVVSVIRKYY